MNEPDAPMPAPSETSQNPRTEDMKITVRKNGPYRVSGGVPLRTVEVGYDDEGTCRTWNETKTYPPQQQQYALCRCGHSKNKPFCDGAHAPAHFVGTETGDRKTAVEEAGDCPSGDLETSIAVIEDPKTGIDGPLRVLGGIPMIGADGRGYEVRNRVSLCRCGRSKNKPFCDGSHLEE